MQEVVIKIKGDSSDIVKLGNELKNLGKIDENNAKQFKKTNDDFKKGANESKSALSEVLSEVTDIRGQLINLGKTLVAAFAVESVITFGKESVAAFMEAELNAKKLNTAITTIGKDGAASFQKLIDQSAILQDKGIFSDDAIQSAQTQLAQYGLFANEIEDIIPLIADMAAATGMDLGQATDMVISGLNGMTRGLKSVGIEFKDTGSMAGNYQEVLKGLNKFQGQMDSVMETSTGKLQNLGNKWEDFKEQVGGVLTGLFGDSEIKQVTDAYDAQIGKVVDLERNIRPLLDRYDDLKTKTNLSKIEQQELDKIISQVSKTIPGAVSEFDNYGKAIAISTNRSRDFIEAEVNKLKWLNKSKIETMSATLEEERAILKRMKVIDDYLEKTGKLKTTEVSAGRGGGMAIDVEVTDPKKIAEFKARLSERMGAVQYYTDEIKKANGDYLKEAIKQAEADQAAREAQRAADEAAAAAERAKAAAKTKTAKDTTDKIKEETTALQALKKAYDDLAAAVDRNTQNGKVDKDLIDKRDKAQRDFNVANNKYKETLEEINGTWRATARDIKEIQTERLSDEEIYQSQVLEMEQRAAKDRAKQEEKTLAEMRLARLNSFLNTTNDIVQIGNATVAAGQQITDALNLQGEQSKAAQKGFALANIAFSTASAIAKIVEGAATTSAQVAAASGPLAPITGPAAYAAFISQIATVLANVLQAKQIVMGYKDGTPSLQRNGNPAGVDTIPIMANEGEAIIPTEKNRQKPGLAAAWIKGNLDDYINVNYVIPALKRNKIDKDEAFASRIGKAISMSASFNDMNLLQSDKENRRILRSIDKTLKSGSMGLSRRKF